MYQFDRFTERLLKADCHEVKIIEDFSDLDANSVSDDIVENTQDTMTILSKYVEDLDTTLDKPRLINIQRQLYKRGRRLRNMIKFKYVRWKNFLSTGNQPIEIQLDKNPTTLIIGENGQNGKSTILDALCFGLFGKPFRMISKNQMVNSINNSSTIVEVEFSVGTVQYKVVRGIKPNKFEIYQNDKMMNLEANVRDYQKILEQQILKLNYGSFTQVVILGSASWDIYAT